MANTFITVSSTSNMRLARIDWNESLDTLLTSFYGDARPTIFSFSLSGSNPATIPDGTFFRSSRLGTLFIKDDISQQNNPFYGGNFTRSGIGPAVEENIVALTANIGNRERGEIVVTANANTRMYVKSTTGGNNFVDIGVPPDGSIVTSMISNNSVSPVKVGPNIAVLTQGQAFTGQQTILNSNAIFNVELVVTSETGNSVIGLNANADSSAGISHVRDGNGVSIVGSDGITLAPIDSSALLIKGIPASTGIGGLKSVQVFTSGGTWTKPAGINKIYAYGVGGGGGGAADLGATTSNPGAGGGGAYCASFINVVSVSSIPVTIGSGGSGGASAGQNGTDGGDTVFGTYFSAGGGSGGSTSGTGGAGGTATSGDVNINGQRGATGGSVFGVPGTIWGMGMGGDSVMGFGGKSRVRGPVGENGRGFGGGGGAPFDPNTGRAGGSGTGGIIVVMEFS